MRLAVSLLLLSSFAYSNAASVRADGATVVINEVPVLTLRASVGKSGPAARAKVLAEKLDRANSLRLGIAHEKAASRITLGGELIILVNKAEASKHGSNPQKLSTAWTEAIRSAWDLPPVKLSKNTVVVPVGGTTTIAIVGSQARSAEVALNNGESIAASRAGATLTIRGKQLGEGSVVVGDQTVAVRVLPYAANFPQTLSVNVVGSPAFGGAVKSAIEGALKGRLKKVSDSTVTWSAVSPGDLPTGEKRSYTVKVVADSPNAFKSEGTVTVNVTNLPIAHRKETELWYCNEPENVKRPQSLFLAHLRQDEPARMLYHHINDSFQGLYFKVMAINTSSQPADVIIMPGDSKDKNPVLAGVLAADPFFRSWLSGSGEVVTIPPKAALPIAFRRLAPQETSSGLCYLRLLPGGPNQIEVIAEAVSPYEIDTTWQAAQRTPTPWREVGLVANFQPTYPADHSTLIFPQPFKQEVFTYQAGGNFAFFRIGQKPIERRDPGKPLDGNFGVIYNIEANAENNTSTPADVELVFEASAGYSGALFALDGRIIRLPLLQAKAEARLARFRLDPGQRKSLSVTTIPLSGSSYPATLVLRPVTNMPDLDYKN